VGSAAQVKSRKRRSFSHGKTAEDLQSYKGSAMNLPEVLRPKFCKHCGQLWYLNRFTDAAGSTDSEYVRHLPRVE